MNVLVGVALGVGVGVVIGAGYTTYRAMEKERRFVNFLDGSEIKGLLDDERFVNTVGMRSFHDLLVERLDDLTATVGTNVSA